MKPETAAAIATKIGMKEVHYDCEPYWEDINHTDEVFSPEEVPTYLATGDRPLRVWAALVVDGWRLVMRQWRPDKAVVLALRETGVQRPDGELRHGEGDTPAAAILSCAEAVEEGHE